MAHTEFDEQSIDRLICIITFRGWFTLNYVSSNTEEEVDEHINLEELKVLSANSPKTLRPAAADAYLMFQVGKIFITLQQKSVNASSTGKKIPMNSWKCKM